MATQQRERLLNEAEVADWIGSTVSSLRTRRCRGADVPPAIRVGRAIRYRPSDVEAWLDERTVQPVKPE